MQQSEYTTRVLAADEDRYLTQAADVAPVNRIITDRVFLAPDTPASAWREVDAAEAEALLAAKKEAQEAAARNAADTRNAEDTEEPLEVKEETE